MKNIFLHGMGQNASSWNDTIAFLSESIDIDVIELSDYFTEGNCSYKNIYDIFCVYCNCLSEPLNLCGLSLGAVLALNYAVEFPMKVNSLILIAPQYKMPKITLKMQNIIFKFTPEKSFENIGFKKNDFIALTNSMADIDLSGKLDKISCPVKIICGESDNFNKNAAIKLNERLKNSSFEVIRNSGHEVNIDNPQKLAEIISKVL